MGDLNVSELELLAPAKDRNIGIAAINCGADAVYIAGPLFGARQAAGNSIGDIKELCDYAHLYGARVFITLNTILYDTELDAAMDQMAAVQEAGADALIVQDLAVLKLAASSGTLLKNFSLPLHASTQCAIRTPEQARFYEDLGFSRLILERELSLEQIHAIRNAVNCELEFFVHGALCVCYSGQCYLSEAITGRSANRGACAQACRSLYDLTDSSGKVLIRNKALLSLKDLNLKDRLSDLAAAGITSFKIEGRLKNISYVKNIVRDYSIALDKLVADSGNSLHRASFGHAEGGFSPAPDKTFNRGYTQLYIDGKRGQWSTFDSAKGMGEEIGTVKSFSPSKDIIRIDPLPRTADRQPPQLHNGDGFSFVARSSETIGFRADICSGMEIRCKPVPELFPGARLFRNLDTSFEKELASNSPVREIHVSVDIRAERTEKGYALHVRAESEDGRKAEWISDAGTQVAGNTGRMESLFISQLSRSASRYRFHIGKITKSSDGSLPFMPVSAINSIRRETAALLDTMPCNARPLTNRTGQILSGTGAWKSGISYKANVSNRLAVRVYTEAGAGTVEPAFELTHRKDAELMRTRYCIRHELGLCPKQTGTGSRHDLYLVNNGRRLILRFDCQKCEMAVLQNAPEVQK